ncbi:MAG: GYF domain-containing protein [Puniceicoccales bacterium]
MAEYYIREVDSEEARGPFTLERLGDLIEAGRATPQTLYYDEEQDDWFPLSENEAFYPILNKEAKRIQLRRSDTASQSALPPAPAVKEPPPVTVDDMLAAAEGTSKETRYLRARQKRMNIAASLSLPALAVMMFLCVFTDIYPYWDTVQLLYSERDWALLLEYPMLILGLVDVFFFICCILSATDVFPLLRVRAMLGLGFFTYIFWSWGELPQSLAVALGSFSIYVCTATLNLYAMVVFAALGIASFGALAIMNFF